MDNIPDQIKIVLQPYRGKNRAQVIEAIQKCLISPDVESEVEETVPVGEAIAIGVAVKITSELAWRAYLHGIEPHLKKLGHLTVQYLSKGKEIPVPKEEEKPEVLPESKPSD